MGSSPGAIELVDITGEPRRIPAPGVIAASATGVVSCIERLNGDVDRIFGEAGIAPEMTGLPTLVLDLNSFCRLFEESARRTHSDGPELAQNISPTGWYLKRGSKFSSHHDAPVAFPDSMRILDATVTRRSRSGDIIGPLQRVDVITALKAMTIWPAYQHFEEKDKGSIEVGKLADFVILSADPTAVDPESLDQLTVAETIKKGNSIYVRGQKRADLMRPRDYVNTGLYEMLKQIYVYEHVRSLPARYRMPIAIASIAATYDDCFASILLADMIGGQSAFGEVAAQ